MPKNTTATKPNKTKTSKKSGANLIPLVDMTPTELSAKARELKHQIAKIRLEVAARKQTNLRSGFNLRKELARVLTVLNTKKASK